MWAWGDNTYGQLGIPKVNNRYQNQYTPEYVSRGEYTKGSKGNENMSNVDGLSAGEYFTVVTTNDREVYAWGDNRYGQLGLGFYGGDTVK